MSVVISPDTKSWSFFLSVPSRWEKTTVFPSETVLRSGTLLTSSPLE
jgi:hypothetical protein